MFFLIRTWQVPQSVFTPALPENTLKAKFTEFTFSALG